ncbi:organic cation transporter protein-like [Pomacea canaliculata]|uniref:organic cation transporter protein-like n=1 Tax=Pomacea canaliculata TaxID=400727 RepID=UPI000D72C078|nr:organic cation transporter protein-like [Pomacea canaliculata]XP_025097995.1 organic cation transporter protein-like [Pomacea canaliculata]
MYFDEVVQAVNPFGPYQKRVYFLLCLFAVPDVLPTLGTVFLFATPEHRCAVPGADNDTWESQGPEHDDLVRRTVPVDPTTGTWSQCLVYKHESLHKLANLANDTIECSQWVYSKENFELTFISELNIVCKDKLLLPLLNSILLGGLLGGSLILGTLADIIGRKKTLVVSVLGVIAATFGAAFVHNYVAFAVLQFFISFFGMAKYLTAFVTGMELVGPQHRTFAGIVVDIVGTIGLYITVLMAYFIRKWNHLQLAFSAVNLIFIPILVFIPESSRWLVSRGRRQEASAIVRHAALVNKAVVPEKMLSLEDLENDRSGGKFWHLFTNPRLLVRCLIVFFNWFVITGIYYGLGLNVGSLPGDIYLNFLYASIAETLSYVLCLVLLNRIGRRTLHCFTMLLGGISCVAIILPVLFGDQNTAWVATALSMVGKFGISAAFAIIYVYTAELFPTFVRNSIMGASSVNARFGSIASPYINSLSYYVGGSIGVALPPLIFGGSAIVAGLASLWLPETHLRQLPETIEDAENFGKKQDKNSYDLSRAWEEISNKKDISNHI